MLAKFNDLVLLSLCAYRHFSQNLVTQHLKAIMKSKFYESPDDKSQLYVDRLCQTTAISLKHMNDPNEWYVAVLVLGCQWYETTYYKIYSLLVQRVLVQLSKESSCFFLKYSLVLSFRLQFAWCCQYLNTLCNTSSSVE